MVSVEIIKENTIVNIANAKYIFDGRQKEEILNFIDYLKYIFTKYITKQYKFIYLMRIGALNPLGKFILGNRVKRFFCKLDKGKKTP